MAFIGNILLLLLDIYFWIIIASVVISWLIAFDVVNTRNTQARNLVTLLEKATNPVFNRLRRYIPAIGGIDITPIIVIFGIYLAKDIVIRIFIL